MSARSAPLPAARTAMAGTATERIDYASRRRRLIHHPNLYKADGLAQNSVFSVYQARDGSVWAGTLRVASASSATTGSQPYQRQRTLANTVASIIKALTGPCGSNDGG